MEMDFNKEFKPIAKMLKSAYTYNSFMPDEYSVNLWYVMLKDLPVEDVKQAVINYVKTESRPPSISDIREGVAALYVNNDHWGDAWETVLKAINKHGYYGEEAALSELTDEAAAAVKSIGWKNLCSSDNTVADRAHFLKIYEIETKRKKESIALGAGSKAVLETKKKLSLPVKDD